jgi:hypothetical protein
MFQFESAGVAHRALPSQRQETLVEVVLSARQTRPIRRSERAILICTLKQRRPIGRQARHPQLKRIPVNSCWLKVHIAIRRFQVAPSSRLVSPTHDAPSALRTEVTRACSHPLAFSASP